MAAALPNSFDYWRRGEPSPRQPKVDDRTFDYYRRTEPFSGFVMPSGVNVPAASAGTTATSITVTATTQVPVAVSTGTSVAAGTVTSPGVQVITLAAGVGTSALSAAFTARTFVVLLSTGTTETSGTISIPGGIPLAPAKAFSATAAGLTTVETGGVNIPLTTRFPNPNTFDYWRTGEPPSSFRAKTSNITFDYYSREGNPFGSFVLVPPPAAAGTSSTSITVQAPVKVSFAASSSVSWTGSGLGAYGGLLMTSALVMSPVLLMQGPTGAGGDISFYFPIQTPVLTVVSRKTTLISIINR